MARGARRKRRSRAQRAAGERSPKKKAPRAGMGPFAATATALSGRWRWGPKMRPEYHAEMIDSAWR